MEFPPVPEESKASIDEAGRTLASDTEYIGGIEHARLLLGRWRACHLLPLRAIADDLGERLHRLGIDAIVAMRLKRLFRVRDKLRQFEGMQVTRMQDMGALRAVVSTLADVRVLQQDYLDNPSPVCSEAPRSYDYIDSPKDGGYRSLHLVLRYRGESPSRYDGLRIELQIRTKLQHLWASAVEVTGLETGSQLKYDEGDPAWSEFFSLTSELIGRGEGAPRSARYHDEEVEALREALIVAERTVGALDTMRASVHRVSQAHVDVETAQSQDRDTVLLQLNLKKMDLIADFYAEAEQQQAMLDYANAEQRQIFEDDGTSVVLVSVNSVNLLREAYPTFFLDTSRFADAVERLLTGGTA